MFKKQLTLFITIIILIILIFISYRCSGEEETPTIYEHDEKFSESILVDGIDVSAYQGDDINWDEVKSSGIDFVMIRAAYRGSSNGEIKIDDAFEENIKGANEANLMVGAYFYSQAINEEEAIEEAEYLVDLVSDYEITMPLVIDLEEYENGRQTELINSGELTSSDITNIALAFCETVEDAGYDSITYGNRNFLTVNHDTHVLEQGTDVWLAHYTDKTNYGGEYIMWQCSDQSSVSGISGNVDKNFWYLDDECTLNDCDIKLKDDSLLYWGRKAEPKVVIKDDKYRLIEEKDYTVSYIKNTSPGTGYVIVQGMNSYSGRAVLEFEINSFF